MAGDPWPRPPVAAAGGFGGSLDSGRGGPTAHPTIPRKLWVRSRVGLGPPFRSGNRGDSLRECVMVGLKPTLQPTLRSRANCGSEVGWALAHLFAVEIGATACVNA